MSGAAAPNYNVSGQLASLSQSATLIGTPRVGIKETLGTGLLTTNATGSALAAESTATIDGLSFGLDSSLFIIPLSLLKISATTIQSYSQANSVGGLDASGHTTIAGLSLSGSALGNLVFDASLFVNPNPNTVLFNLAGLSIILNEQVASGDGVTFSGISTNAIAVRFNNFALGTGLANGAVIIGHTQAAAWAGQPSAPVPEPTTWAMLLLGFSTIGYAIRRRRLAFA
ncbi:MAG: PEPxxWA-CTERM sorting domain-containing protein [Alphaproteobacteria bacterium]|nr:PEPxxWA-CTERM sorting domain-containing protein [Alphaproteobacteria bacterium]MBU1513784.1 PEPxxWA-CTERM sorting domain-containing protein [Alphaproteobacteria bacterium]MBU2094571.1 PEPxxWA-CTERM sorting domain-containing protein [Alphaproteobacteria bacterium]MBU2149670.1 PEPxxWA-CTERM sorting domain-containing protein [Alphaproteobacteria bacterium]MBU2309111.1 PEPxxWA-CTERM sorting domain-containing protein [Alphaproteobacteria bacterium]